MTTLEIFRLDEKGAGFVSLDKATTSEKLDLELAIVTNAPVKVTRTTPLPVGFCKVCEQPHKYLYCSNCFTGERVRITFSRFASVIKLTPTQCLNRH